MGKLNHLTHKLKYANKGNLIRRMSKFFGFLKKSTMYISFFLFTSCGFHLRGMLDMPEWFNDVAVLAQNGNHDLDPLIRDRLKTYRIRVYDEPYLAHYRLLIQKDSFQQQISSVSSSTTPRQYQLIYTVCFSLLDQHGKVLIPPSVILVTRQITINSDRILGSDQEEALTKMEMRREAAMQLLYRVGSLLPTEEKGSERQMRRAS